MTDGISYRDRKTAVQRSEMEVLAPNATPAQDCQRIQQMFSMVTILACCSWCFMLTSIRVVSVVDSAIAGAICVVCLMALLKSLAIKYPGVFEEHSARLQTSKIRSSIAMFMSIGVICLGWMLPMWAYWAVMIVEPVPHVMSVVNTNEAVATAPSHPSAQHSTTSQPLAPIPAQAQAYDYPPVYGQAPAPLPPLYTSGAYDASARAYSYNPGNGV
ncbi:hypothetical protein KIPB_009417 [Kipferlia bialata]|uniref:Transmembrane protein n=1 Tax=Kipferlia bialata TaxID=797122 RepID=A0A9K3GM37_9EUKA|nr:hypothetical protein KIPB_009417 [Kipferlia bialata]|eukprot:g9417.t1